MIGMARRSTAKGFSEPKTPYTPQPRKGGERVKEIARAKRGLPAPETLPDGTTRYFLVLGPKGRVLLPAEMRVAMGLEQGDVITAWLKGGELRLHSHAHGLRKIQAGASAMASGSTLASDELIAERRAEARRAAEEALIWLRDRKPKRKRR
jgi:bifunctional DNA-binding transcriptional regulator/antitoxin component of YhaV-PrlF toxin-antitoxin module